MFCQLFEIFCNVNFDFYFYKAQQQKPYQSNQQLEQNVATQKPIATITQLIEAFDYLGIYPFGTAVGAQSHSHSEITHGDISAQGPSYQTESFQRDAIEQNGHQRDLRLKKIPPNSYMCHLCFGKGHFIRDCPLVSLNKQQNQNVLQLFFILFD